MTVQHLSIINIRSLKRIQKIFTLLQTSHLPEFENPRQRYLLASNFSFVISSRGCVLLEFPIRDPSFVSSIIFHLSDEKYEGKYDRQGFTSPSLSPIYLFISSNNFSTRERKFKRSYNFIFHSCNNFSLISRNSRISKIARGDAKHVHRWIFTYVKFLSRFSVHSRFNFFFFLLLREKKGEPKRFRFADRKKIPTIHGAGHRYASRMEQRGGTMNTVFNVILERGEGRGDPRVVRWIGW